MAEIFILAINGSPHIKGNTSYLLRQALDECARMGAKTKMLHCQQVIKGLKVPFCVACSSPCSGRCFEDSQLQEALELMCQADGIILGSPVYFGTVSGQLKAFWDKTRSLRSARRLLNVAGGAITVGGSRFGGQETTIRALHDMMLIQGMIILGDGYYEDDCGHLGPSAQQPSDQDEEGIKRARILGKRITQVAGATRSLRMK